MKTVLKLDHAGRLVLPKAVRQRFNLCDGSTLDLEVDSDAIVLRPQSRNLYVIEEHGMMIHEGVPVGDLDRAVETLREDRARSAGGL